jgi:phage terminase small subunit
MKGDKLSARQENFCQQYLIDLNASAAYKRAGYKCTPTSANVSASQLLARAKITDRIAYLRLNLQKKTNITQERVLAEYAKIAFADVRKFYGPDGQLVPIHELDDDTAGALAGLEIDEIDAGGVCIGQTKKIKITDKKGALDSLAKHLGMFVEKVEHSGAVTVRVVDYASLHKPK